MKAKTTGTEQIGGKKNRSETAVQKITPATARAAVAILAILEKGPRHSGELRELVGVAPNRFYLAFRYLETQGAATREAEPDDFRWRIMTGGRSLYRVQKALRDAFPSGQPETGAGKVKKQDDLAENKADRNSKDSEVQQYTSGTYSDTDHAPSSGGGLTCHTVSLDTLYLGLFISPFNL